jgi:hypothetical protein
VCSCGQEAAAVEEQNAIGQLNRFRSMRNQERRASGHGPFQSYPNLIQGFTIEMGRRLIRQEEAGFA